MKLLLLQGVVFGPSRFRGYVLTLFLNRASVSCSRMISGISTNLGNLQILVDNNGVANKSIKFIAGEI